MRQLVYLLHGIRTQAEWVTRAEKIFNERVGTRTIPILYEYFDVLRFLLPFSGIRNRAVELMANEINAELAREPAELCIVAHSFGTYVVSKLLETHPYIKVSRLIFCGAIVKNDYDWRRVSHQIGKYDGGDWQAINDCGMRDILPVLAKAVTWGYGSSGRFGFGRSNVRDRYFGLGHSGFFTEDFIRKYWVPYLDEGRIVDGVLDRPTTPWWVSMLTILTVPNLFYAAMFLGIAVLLISIVVNPTPEPVPQKEGIESLGAPRKGSGVAASATAPLAMDFLSNNKAWRERSLAQYRARGDGTWSADGSRVQYYGSISDSVGYLNVDFDETAVRAINYLSSGDLNSTDEESRKNCDPGVWPAVKGNLVTRYGQPTSSTEELLEPIKGNDPISQQIVSTLYQFETDEPLVAECAKDKRKCQMTLYSPSIPSYARHIFTFKALDGTIINVDRWQVNYLIKTLEAQSRESDVSKCGLKISFR